MATTSPDNLRTPDFGDSYNLVPDLQTLANDVQAALTSRDAAAVGRGTAAQRATALSGSLPGRLWQDTDGIRMLWKRGTSAWEPAVWRWSGTTAQMNAFTQAPNGFEWYNTTDNSEYARLGGSWTLAAPEAVHFTQAVTPSGGGSSSGIFYSGGINIVYPSPIAGKTPKSAKVSYYSVPGQGAVAWWAGTDVLPSSTQLTGRIIRVGSAPSGGQVQVSLFY